MDTDITCRSPLLEMTTTSSPISSVTSTVTSPITTTNNTAGEDHSPPLFVPWLFSSYFGGGGGNNGNNNNNNNNINDTNENTPRDSPPPTPENIPKQSQHFDLKQQKGNLILNRNVNNNNNPPTSPTSPTSPNAQNTKLTRFKVKKKDGSEGSSGSGSLERSSAAVIRDRRRQSSLWSSSTSVPVAGISLYRERVLVYNFLQRPSGRLAIGYHIGVSAAVVVCLVLTIMSTSSVFAPSVTRWLDTLDHWVVAFFIVEFIARLWACECVSSYRGLRGKVRFFRNPVRLVDLFVIVVSIGVIITGAQGELLVTSLRGVRFLQIFQMVRLDHKFRPWSMMASVVHSQRVHLAIVLYMGFLALLCVSFVIYFVERDANPDFEGLPAALWWAVVSLTTIGYGDMYPRTATGKVLTCFCALIGVSIFALPAGILGTGLALKVQEQQRQVKLSKRQQPAARLIQLGWKCYRFEHDLSVGRHCGKQRRSVDQIESMEEGKGGVGHEHCYQRRRSILWRRFESAGSKSRSNKSSQSRQLTRPQLAAVRFIIAVRFALARRDFQGAFKPYDIKDVLEQYSAGHADMLATVKAMDHRLERLQCAGQGQSDRRAVAHAQLVGQLSKLEYDLQQVVTVVGQLAHAHRQSTVVAENVVNFLVTISGGQRRQQSRKTRFLPVSPKEGFVGYDQVRMQSLSTKLTRVFDAAITRREGDGHWFGGRDDGTNDNEETDELDRSVHSGRRRSC